MWTSVAVALAVQLRMDFDVLAVRGMSRLQSQCCRWEAQVGSWLKNMSCLRPFLLTAGLVVLSRWMDAAV
jgi:hypothetical protein